MRGSDAVLGAALGGTWPIARCPEPLRQMSYLDVSTWEADVAVNIRNFFAARFARGYAR